VLIFIKKIDCDLKPVSFDHFDILFIVFYRNYWTVFCFMLLNMIFILSENKLNFTGFFMVDAMSYIAIRNSIADMFEHCGMQFSCMKRLERVLPILTRNVLLLESF